MWSNKEIRESFERSVSQPFGHSEFTPARRILLHGPRFRFKDQSNVLQSSRRAAFNNYMRYVPTNASYADQEYMAQMWLGEDDPVVIGCRDRLARYYVDLHQSSMWGSYADKTASLRRTGSSFFVSPIGDECSFALRMRNGLNGHKCCMLIRRSVRARNGLVCVKRIGRWDGVLS